jgi:hypothetical protein
VQHGSLLFEGDGGEQHEQLVFDNPASPWEWRLIGPICAATHAP